MGSRQSSVGSYQLAVHSRQSAVHSQQSTVYIRHFFVLQEGAFSMLTGQNGFRRNPFSRHLSANAASNRTGFSIPLDCQLPTEDCFLSSSRPLMPGRDLRFAPTYLLSPISCLLVMTANCFYYLFPLFAGQKPSFKHNEIANVHF